MVGCLAFVIYATVFIHSFSTAFMNGALFVVHIIFLVKDYLARKKNSAAVEVPAEQNQSKQIHTTNEETTDDNNTHTSPSQSEHK